MEVLNYYGPEFQKRFPNPRRKIYVGINKKGKPLWDWGFSLRWAGNRGTFELGEAIEKAFEAGWIIGEGYAISVDAYGFIYSAKNN